MLKLGLKLGLGAPSGGTASEFTPASLGARLLQWQQTNKVGGVVQSGNAISQLTDFSQYGRHWTQSSAGAKPTWDGTALTATFDGSTDYMFHTDPYMYNAAGTITLFFVARVAGQSNQRVWISESNNAVSSSGIQNTYQPFRQGGGGGAVTQNQSEAWSESFADIIFSTLFTNASPATIWTGTGAESSIYTFKDTKTVLSFRKDGAAVSADVSYARSGKTMAVNRNTIGCKIQSTDVPAEFAGMAFQAFAAVLDCTDQERDQMEEYFQAQYGVELSFASIQNQTFQARKTVASADGFGWNFPHILGSDRRSLRVAIPAWYQTNIAEVDLGNDISIESIAINNGTTTVPVNFSGSRTATLVNGTEMLVSDPIPASAFGLSKFSRGETYWCKGKVGFTSGQYMLDNCAARVGDIANCQTFFYIKASTTVSTTDATGVFTFTGSTPTQEFWAFNPWLGGQAMERVDTPCAIGNSILKDGGNTHGIYGRGPFQLGMQSGSDSLPIPACNLSCGGANLILYSGFNKWKTPAAWANITIDNNGINDILGGTPQATMESRFTTIWAACAAAGHTKRVSFGIMPVTSSTDSWATTGNQTKSAAVQAGALAETINNYKIASVTNGKITAYNSFPSVRAASDFWLWDVPSFTGDGLHCAEAGSLAGGTDVRGVL